MNRAQRRTQRRKHQKTISQYSSRLKEINRDEYKERTGNDFPPSIVSAFVSKSFFVQVHNDEKGFQRISVCRNKLDGSGSWSANISWDELQAIKNEIGYSDKDCIEIYPKYGDEVNVSNMRHLWVLVDPLSFAWRVESKRKEIENEKAKRASADETTGPAEGIEEQGGGADDGSDAIGGDPGGERV